MTTNQPLSLFISSKMAELAEERRAVQFALSDYQMFGWLFEKDAGARPETIQSTYLQEVEACDLYIGLFWLGYGPYTIEEYEKARSFHKPCLVYEKQVDTDKRDPHLTTFLKDIQTVTDPKGVTVFRFNTKEELAAQVLKDVMHLLTTTFRQSRQQPVQVWYVPFRRNPFFTGREQLLTHLHENLTQTGAAALIQAQAISGLGGIGKTQTAVEYAYRYMSAYRYVLCVNASSRDTLVLDFVTLANLLDLPEKQAQDQNITIAAAKQWLATHDQWLLILDNADELEVVNDFLPTDSQGHILITTRAQATGTIASSIEVQKMDTHEGTLLLLRRAKVLAPNAPLDRAPEEDRTNAEAIVAAMDGLPLALNQAGAYIDETGCTVSSYLEQYHRRQIDLLKRRGGPSMDHPEPVATTWSLSFEKIEHLNPTAADLLRLCAFLSPDAIPIEMIVAGATHLSQLLQPIINDPSLLDEPIAILRRYSLVRRHTENNTLSIHRLVQAILKSSMNDETQLQWAERTVRAVNQAFPDNIDVDTWPQCGRYLSHTQACAALIRQYNLAFPEAARLLDQAAWYLHDCALYEQAEPLFQQALAIKEQVLGPDHLDTATSLNNLVWLYFRQDKYEQAEPLCQRALAIREKALGPEHPDTASTLYQLAMLYQDQGKYEQAEPLYQRALAIREKALGPEHPDTASTLHELARLYQHQGKYEQAEPLYQRALAIREKALGPEHPDTASTLHELARLYHNQGKYEQVESLYQRALAIREKALGPEHPDTATTLRELAWFYYEQGEYTKAQPLLQEALTIYQKVFGNDHFDTGVSFKNLALLRAAQGDYRQAEILLNRALNIHEKVLGADHPEVAIDLNNLARLHQKQDKYAEAELLYQRALAIREKTLGPEHPDTASSLHELSRLYKDQGKYE